MRPASLTTKPLPLTAPHFMHVARQQFTLPCRTARCVWNLPPAAQRPALCQQLLAACPAADPLPEQVFQRLLASRAEAVCRAACCVCKLRMQAAERPKGSQPSVRIVAPVLPTALASLSCLAAGVPFTGQPLNTSVLLPITLCYPFRVRRCCKRHDDAISKNKAGYLKPYGRNRKRKPSKSYSRSKKLAAHVSCSKKPAAHNVCKRPAAA